MAEQIVKVKIDLDVTDFNKNAKAMQTALANILGKEVEVFNGKIAKTKQLLEQTEKAMGSTASTIKTAGSSVKESNIQWQNLALVIQDLPFGFRGIQNNLPALAGSIAGVAGPAYLAFSALVAVITAYDMGIFGAKKTTDDFAKSLKNVNDELKKAKDYTNSDVARLESLLRVGLNLNNSEQVRLNALKDIKKILGDVNKAETDKINSIEEAIIPVNLYTEALKKQNLQEITSNKIAELTNKIIEQKQKVQLAKGIEKRSPGLLKILFGYSDISEMQLEITTAETMIRQLESVLDQANKKTFNPFGDKKVKADVVVKDDTLEKAQDVQIQNYIDTLSERNKEIVKSELKLQDDIATLNAAGFTNYEGALAANRARVDKINQTYDEAQWKVNEKNRNDTIAFETKLYNDLRKIDEDNNKAFVKESERVASQQAKNVETELSIQEKLHKGSLTQRIEDTRVAMAKLAAMAMMSLDPASMKVYLDMFDKMDAKLKGYGTTWKQTIVEINKAIFDFVNNSIVFLGESLGKALAGENVDVFNGLAMLLADGLSMIGKALISFAITEKLALMALSNPLSWPVALAAGFAAVTAGAFLKSTLSADKTKKFANGGIISGPTMGLMGEYPGAQNNPEVVAPLDKLKEMIGGSNGGGGQFVLRGQDLLLSVNRAQKASNLKGQNISLA